MIATQYHYGGIIPYYCDEQGVYYLLLGRESYDQTWAPFGGHTETGENITTASTREAYEETMGILGSWDQIQTMISQAKYGIVYCNTRGSRPGGSWSFQFLIPIAREDALALPNYFNNVYQYLTHCSNVARASEGCYEKTELAWFPLTEVMEAVLYTGYIYNNPTYPVRPVFDKSLLDGTLVKLPSHQVNEFAEAQINVSPAPEVTKHVTVKNHKKTRDPS